MPRKMTSQRATTTRRSTSAGRAIALRLPENGGKARAARRVFAAPARAPADLRRPLPERGVDSPLRPRPRSLDS